MIAREERSAMNEALFRELNERFDDRLGRMGDEGETNFVCECSEIDCTERIAMTREEYRAAHEHPARFTVALGHAVLDIEDVVLRTDRYEVVEKTGVAGQVAEALASDSASAADPLDGPLA